jgi:hypothetical protein
MAASDQDIHTLFRYFCCATQLKGDFHKTLEAYGAPSMDAKQVDPWLSGPFAHACYYFAGLHVVLEGWMRIGLSDAEVDKLRLSPHVDVLRRYRNGAFHFQRDYFDARFRDFVANHKALSHWADALHEAFRRYFSEWQKQSNTPATESERNTPASEAENSDFELNL